MPMVDRSRHRDTHYSEKILSMPAQPHAIEKIKSLVGLFEGNVWIVSKAGPRTEALTRQWLQDKDFFNLTGLIEDHLIFCREREQKKPICAELEITHFIDDRIHIMQILKETVGNLYLFGDKSKNCCAKRWTNLVSDWPEAHETIVRDSHFNIC